MLISDYLIISREAIFAGILLCVSVPSCSTEDDAVSCHSVSAPSSCRSVLVDDFVLSAFINGEVLAEILLLMALGLSAAAAMVVVVVVAVMIMVAVLAVVSLKRNEKQIHCDKHFALAHTLLFSCFFFFFRFRDNVRSYWYQQRYFWTVQTRIAPMRLQGHEGSATAFSNHVLSIRWKRQKKISFKLRLLFGNILSILHRFQKTSFVTGN